MANVDWYSAGGGGKTKQRQEKIREKNRKLDENRSKRIEKEKNVKVEKKQEHSNPMEGSMHPSRMARTPGLAH
jgi:nucleolar protein 6